MFIYLIAGIVLAIILAGFFYRDQITSLIQRFRGGGAALQKTLSLLPEVSLNLDPSSSSEWENKTELEQDESKLEKQGLVHQGYFCQRTNNSFIELSLWKYKDIVTIVLTNTIPEVDNAHLESKYSAEVFVKLDNGGSLCISNSENANLLPRNPKHKIVQIPTSDIFQLMKSLKEHTPEGCKIIQTSDPLHFFTAVYEEVSDWIWQEAQLISSAFEEACEAQDITLSDDDIDELIELGQSKLAKSYSDRILRRLENSSQIDRSQWQDMRERLVVIHEKMGAEDITNALYQIVTELTVDQEEMIEEFSSSGQVSDPIASFGELMASLSPSSKPIATMKLPVVSEVYLSN